MSDDILDRVVELKSKPIKEVIDKRLSEFNSFRSVNVSSEELFLELAFCLMTANFSASGGLRIQKALGNELITLPEQELAKKLVDLSHRFPNARAKYIFEARKHLPVIKDIVNSKNGLELRDWFVDNVKGLGFKESSHFLRNVGFTDFAIVDFHIVDILNEHNLLEGSGIVRKKPLNKARYLFVEKVLQDLGKKLGMNMAELDLYLWYLETGKVLK